jgi:hypothetical protein
MYLLILLGSFLVFVACCGACEYGNYSTGHRFVRAFSASSKFQRLLTILQSRGTVHQWDMYKLTYIGYYSSLFSIGTGFFVVPTCFILTFFNRGIFIWILSKWFILCFALEVFVFLLQIFDSILNYLFELFERR